MNKLSKEFKRFEIGNSTQTTRTKTFVRCWSCLRL